VLVPIAIEGFTGHVSKTLTWPSAQPMQKYKPEDENARQVMLLEPGG